MKKKVILLFYPKTERENSNKNIPLSLLKVGSELKSAGYRIMIIDERFQENYTALLEEILPETLFFGVSSMTGYQIKGGLNASAAVKKINREVPVVWGGWHPSILPEETLLNDNLDMVVIGQGEITSRELAEALSHNLALDEVDGIGYKRDGKIFMNRRREFSDINQFAPVVFDLFGFERYILSGPLGERTIYWNSSQGCPYQCGFCNTSAVYKRRWSGLDTNRLLEEIGVLVKKFKIDGITFTEDNFFVDRKRAEGFCRGIIDRNMKLNWATDVRIDQINNFSDELMQLLNDAGCTKLYIGAESGDDQVLEMINKKISADDTFKAAGRLNKYGIIADFFIMVGFPLNPMKDLMQSLEMIKNIKINFPEHQFTPFVFAPYPATPLLDTALKSGLKIPRDLGGWQDWGILTVNTPWIDTAYLDKINMYVKCFYPLAFPSASLKERFKHKYKGILYKLLHRLSVFRIMHNYFAFPVEWTLVKTFYKIKVKFNLFRGFDSFR